MLEYIIQNAEQYNSSNISKIHIEANRSTHTPPKATAIYIITMFSVRILSIVLVLYILRGNNAQDTSILRSVRECLRTNSSVVCLKEKALRIIDEAMASDKPLKVSDYVDIVKDPNFQPDKSTLQVLPKDLQQRSEKLNDILVKKVDEFFESRTIKFNLANVFDEGIFKKKI